MFNFRRYVPCPFCGAYDSRATTTQGNIQSRKCNRCYQPFKNIGDAVEVDITDLPK